MVWWKGAAAVSPDSVEDSLDEPHPERRGLAGWIRRHPVITSVSITFLILGVIAAIVVPITCSIHGCAPKKAQVAIDPLYQDAPFRLVVSFLSDIDVKSVVPPLLRNFTSRVQLALSNLQVLEAVDEFVLNAVFDAIRGHPELEFLVRDFVLRAPSTLADLTGGSGRRSLQQAVSLNDPGLSSAYWFNRINVTGAWQLLKLNMSDPQRQTSDVIIAVTDSGATVDHPDLIGSFWTNPLETDDNLTDDDGNVFIDDVYGACFSTSQCSPTYAGNNISRCGIGRNTSSWNGIIDRTTHGTKIAGIIGARPNNGIGIAGVAPNLRQMILKVTDESFDPANPPYAYSDVVRAVDYAYGKGARIFSMSFGNNARSSITPFNKASLDAAASAYKTLFTKYDNALFVAAAGNEWTNLDTTWLINNNTYSPCMVNTPNVLCVGGTTSADAIFYTVIMNQEVGTNYGPSTVDMGAPGMMIYTTDTPYNGNYSTVSGTSFSTPMTAAAAGLVLAALGGQSFATSQTPSIIKNILMTSGDDLPGLKNQFKSSKRLNVGNAVAAALTRAATNRTVVSPSRSITNMTTSVAFQGWEYLWWQGDYTDGRFDTSDPTYTFVDFQVRNQPTSTFNPPMRYTSGYKMMATTMARIDTAGAYSIQFRASSISIGRWQLSVGDNAVVWNIAPNNTGTADFIFTDPGYYNLTLWMFPEVPSSTVNFVWQVPGPNPSAWVSPAFCWTLHETPASTRYYDPNLTAKPALWHVVWNETASFGDFLDPLLRGYFAQYKDPNNYRMMQSTVSDFAFQTGSDMRNALYGVGGAPANNQTVVYGYARANLRPLNFTTGVCFRLQGPNSRLYVDDQLIFDFQSDTQHMIVSPCITLQSNVPHEIYFYFAARFNSSNPVGLTWATCTGTTVPAGTNQTAYTSLSSSLATNYLWTPPSTNTLIPGFRCDAWPGNLSISALGTTPVYGTPPVLSWMYPRDCPASYRTARGDCRMQTRLIDLFPNVTWNVWNVRCWTFWSSSLTRGLTGAQVLGGPIFQHLAGVRVYYQPGDGIQSYNFAPYTSRLPSGVLQLYVIEWVAFAQQWNLLASQTIWDGVLKDGTLADILTTNNSTMFLPAAAATNFTWRNVLSA